MLIHIWIKTGYLGLWSIILSLELSYVCFWIRTWQEWLNSTWETGETAFSRGSNLSVTRQLCLNAKPASVSLCSGTWFSKITCCRTKTIWKLFTEFINQKQVYLWNYAIKFFCTSLPPAGHQRECSFFSVGKTKSRVYIHLFVHTLCVNL